MTNSSAAQRSSGNGPEPRGRPARCGAPDADSDFTYIRTSASELPDPERLLINLTRSVIEVLHGARDLEQLARWISEDVYQKLLMQTSIAARARMLKRQHPALPVVRIGRVHMQTPVDDVCEAVVMVQAGKARARAVAIRLEGIDRRWRATSIGVL
ncbi:hypothetical protein SAMN04489806_2390 [Paramicrobacterium humi]|uniref:3-hydroxyacyl-CoA dehydrogenase n=2 Tax=Paramicrobacterium humi TaxID=640635 RepID=A0A1H4P422_9MICO|nr:hypothetical protein SAMN04489806_2390 [Microbacterium humi]